MRNLSPVYLLLAGLITYSTAIYSQTKKTLTLNEAVESAIQNNANIKIAEWDTKISHANYRQTDAAFLPQVELNYTALSTNNPLNAFGFLLQQSSVTAMDFDPAKLNSPGSVQDYSAKAEVKLPLFNMDMIYARKGAKYQEEAYKYKVERTKQHIELEVKKAYTQLQFSYLAKSILEKTLDDVKKIEQSVNNFYEQGLVQKSDLLNAQVQVNTIESALTKAESNIKNASEGLKLLMGEEDAEVYAVDTLVLKDNISNSTLVSLSRSDFTALNKAIKATDMMIKSSKASYLPRINAFGTYQLNDSKVFHFKADSYLVGINLSWKIITGNQNRNKIKSFEFQKSKLQEEVSLQIKQSQLELNKTQRDLQDIQVEINKKNISVKQAEEALRILSDRYKEGLANTTDLLASQAQLSQQRLLRAQSIMTYNITQAYLDFIQEVE